MSRESAFLAIARHLAISALTLGATIGLLALIGPQYSLGLYLLLIYLPIVMVSFGMKIPIFGRLMRPMEILIASLSSWTRTVLRTTIVAAGVVLLAVFIFLVVEDILR